MASPIVHVEVRGLDSSELREFYAEVFGWRRDEALSYGDYSVGLIGNGELTAATGAVADWQANSATFYIQVDDIDSTIELIERLGGQAIMPKQVGPDDFPSRHINVFTKFIDPAGNVVGLVEAPR
ncbi:MAG: hypothetical protein HKN91_17495 [Acidimicrobiia bacterium]|nr:hypothetical protein [Acidimicrobiia bacterium]